MADKANKNDFMKIKLVAVFPEKKKVIISVGFPNDEQEWVEYTPFEIEVGNDLVFTLPEDEPPAAS